MTKPRIIAFTGLPMTGKSTSREVLQRLLDERQIKHAYVHFGSTEEVERRNQSNDWPDDQKDLTMEQKERLLREEWRRELGMGAMAIKKLPEIERLLNEGHLILIDNLYSDEERAVIAESFGWGTLLLIATIADWPVRVRRARNRPYRPLSEAELKERDAAEIYNLNKAPTIALAPFTILNNADESADPERALQVLENELRERILPNIIE